MAKTGVSRRSFMKISLSCMAGAAIHLKSFPESLSDKKKKGVSRTSLKPLQAIPTTCQQCPAGCGIIAYLNGEQLVQILGNPDHPNNQGGICSKGVAGINLVNDPERLLYPMKRIGPRGANRWTRISWDEAIYRLSDRIIKLMKQDRIREMVVDKGQSDPLLDLFIDSLDLKQIIDRPVLKNINRSSAMAEMTGIDFFIEDVGRSRTILNFGANPFANHDHYIGMARRMIQSRMDRGAQLITFDVRMSETAAKSNEWLPLRAGTDGLVALAIAHMMLELNLVNKTFIQRQTNTSLPALKAHLSPYTPQRAEEESGIKAEDIKRLAVAFAQETPSVAVIGGGATDHQNGHLNTKCISLLNWLVGNGGMKGGLLFPPFEDFPAPKSLNPSPFSSLTELLDAEKRLDTYFAFLSNPAFSDPDAVQCTRKLKNDTLIPFVVVMDTHLTETALLADMVLPAATYLEGWGVSPAPPLDGRSIINFRQPVVSLVSQAEALRSLDFDTGLLLDPRFQPKGESKEVGNLCLALARKVGGSLHKNLPYKNTQDYVKKTVSELSGQGLDIQSLKTSGVWIGQTKNTSSKPERIRISSQTLPDKEKAHLPFYQPLFNIGDMKSDQFILTPFKSNLHSPGTENSKWSREIFHQNPLWMNKASADRLGIKKGDRVRVSSSAGSLVAQVLTTHRIHPDSVALAEGFGHTAVGKVAQARPFRSADRDTQLLWWHKKGKGVNPYEIVESIKDSLGGGPASKDTLVQVKKIEE